MSDIKVIDPMPDFTKIDSRLYLGMDVGGTKIRTALVGEDGTIYAFLKEKTPRDCDAEVTIQAIEKSIHALLDRFSLPQSRITAIGIAIPGVVEPQSGDVVVTPNMNLTGIPLGKRLRDDFGIPVFLGNDGNLGTLGETWLGAAHNSQNAVGIFVGTGVGSGIVTNGKLWTGAGHGAGEIGHIVVQTPARNWKARLGALLPEGVKAEELPEFPVCGCGNVGCLETFASRTAMEHEIQEALKLGVPSCIPELCGGDVSLIKAGTIAKALKANDPLVTVIVNYTAEVLAYACLTVRHLIDPDVIVLGGGVMEACHVYFMPIIEKIMEADQLPAAQSQRKIVLSELGDDAVVIGAVALARSGMNHGETPVKIAKEKKAGPKFAWDEVQGVMYVGSQEFDSDFFINTKGVTTLRTETDGKIHRSELKSFVDGDVSQIIIGVKGAKEAQELNVTQKAIDFLTQKGIFVRVCPMDEAAAVMNCTMQPTVGVFLIR
ncbi:MAG: ROK family protein [Thermoguttaceae bacterium]|nr:ROK family protein [Thermoguttaceae bacterium]